MGSGGCPGWSDSGAAWGRDHGGAGGVGQSGRAVPVVGVGGRVMCRLLDPRLFGSLLHKLVVIGPTPELSE